MALSACGNSGTDKGADSGSKAETAAADSGSKAETADGDVFTIGTTGPLTGSAASYGNSVKNGATIAIDEINAAGGVKVGDKTYKLALNFQDDSGVSTASSTTCVPPCKSRPCRIEFANGETKAKNTPTITVMTASNFSKTSCLNSFHLL